MANYNKAIVRYKRTNELAALAECYLKLGDCYSIKKNDAAAIENYKLSMKYGEESRAYQFFFFSILKIGSIYREAGQINTALDYHNKALQITTNVNMPEPIAVVKLVLAEDYFYNKDYKKARQMAYDANQFFISNGSLADIEKSERYLYKTDSILGDYKSAFYHYQLYLDANSKLKSEDFKKVSQNEKFKSDLEKQKLEQKAIQEKRDAKAREDQARQQWIIYSIIAILVLIVAFSFVLFRRYKQINKQNHIIEWQKKLVEEKHKEITDSINYSERIQRSFLASTNLLDKNLKNYFILFKPKDVVSGDFYWADTLPNGDFILVTADSTGHGVPGAIMSILNISSLENAVEKGLLNPAEILMHSRTRIIERLKKDGSVDGGKDGMDCSAIVFNPERTKLKFSAAHNPVWIIRDNQLIELTPDKMPVAKHDKDHLPFTEKEIDLYKNDLIITLTDGYPDQFGGEKGKKFKYKNLSDLLIQLSSLDENAMKSALEHTFDSWKGDLEQVDDVCLIGIRI